MKKIFTLLALVAISFNLLHAQDASFCDAESRTQESVEKNPSAAFALDQLESFTQAYIQQNPDFERSSSTHYVIPMVVHIMHDYSSSANIPKANVLSALDILNTDFNVLNDDTNLIVSQFKPIIGGLDIEFKLATIDPQGNCTDGITRHYTQLTNAADEGVKSIVSWNTAKYYNVWVVKNIASGSGGYAYIPGTAPTPAQEGVVCRSSQFGGLSPSGGSVLARRTLTHETGHYLGLRHTWGPTNSPGSASNCGFDDGVTDTPICRGMASQSCPTSQNSCSEDTVDYGFDQIDNVQNYMDYSSCERMFTNGQAQRMDAALNSTAGSRNQLWNPSNLIATGVDSAASAMNCAMKVDFTASKTVICTGTNIQLNDQSWNGDADSWNWIITGPGTPSMSSTTDSSITVSFPSTGSYTVTLEVTNSAGTVSETRVDFIGVMSNTPVFSNWHNENFEGITSLPNGYISEGNGDELFELNTNVGWSNSTQSIWLNNFKNDIDDVSSFILPTFEVPNTTSPVLSFDYAYARRTSSSAEVLKIYVSSNCGASWSPRLTLNTSDLSTAPNSALNEFTPQSINQWKNAEVNLSAFKAASNIAIKFELTTSQGNNFYVDNINLKDAVLGISEDFLPSDIKLIPNPVQNEANISFSLGYDADLDIQVLDLMGKQVLNYGAQSFKSGENQFNLNLNGTLPSGVYIIALSNEHGKMQQRFVVSQ